MSKNPEISALTGIRMLAAAGIIAGITGVASCGSVEQRSSVPDAHSSQSSGLTVPPNKEYFSLQEGEFGVSINYLESTRLGSDVIEFQNLSREVNLTIVPARIPEQLQADLGLQGVEGTLLVQFVDFPYDPSRQEQAQTYYDPKRGAIVSQIVVTRIIKAREEGAKKTNALFYTGQEKRGQLSLDISSATIVEMANQVQIIQKKSQELTKEDLEKIDIISNLLGAKYAKMLKAGLEPFIVVNPNSTFK